MRNKLLSLAFMGLTSIVNATPLDDFSLEMVESTFVLPSDYEASVLFRSKQKRYSIRTPSIFQNPFMAPNNFSEIHNNSYQTDTFSIRGPGRFDRTTFQGAFIDPLVGIAGTIAFNSSGQIVTIRTGGSIESAIKDIEDPVFNTLLLIDPDTLQVIASTDLPPRKRSTSGVSFAGGGYFYLDNSDRVVCVTSTQQVRIYELLNNQFELVQTYDLTAAINNPDDILNSLLPDNSGNLWFITKEALIGYIDPISVNVYIVSIRNTPDANPNETNTKSFASDENGGIFVLTDYALYRFQAGLEGVPVATWRATYDRGVRIKPGQNQQGSGTTPTLFNDFEGNEFVAIADNADPFLHVLVFNRNTGELISQQEVFSELPFRNSCENSLIAVNHSVMIENNYGNVNLRSTAGSATTEPGLARIDFDPDSGESKVVWTNYKISIPSIVSGLSTKDGLIYTYCKDSKSWFFAAVDYRNGKLVSGKRMNCPGPILDILANNFYGGLNIGPDHTVYAGVLGGIVAWRPNKENCCCN